MNIRKMARVTLAAGSLALPTLATFATPETRSDIDPAKFPSGWDVSKRTTYQVEVAEASYDWFDSEPLSVREFRFSLSSMPPGLMLLIR